MEGGENLPLVYPTPNGGPFEWQRRRDAGSSPRAVSVQWGRCEWAGWRRRAGGLAELQSGAEVRARLEGWLASSCLQLREADPSYMLLKEKDR